MPHLPVKLTLELSVVMYSTRTVDRDYGRDSEGTNDDRGSDWHSSAVWRGTVSPDPGHSICGPVLRSFLANSVRSVQWSPCESFEGQSRPFLA